MSNHDKRNPVVFLIIAIDGRRLRRMVFELHADVVPRTAENFRRLCLGASKQKGTKTPPLEYMGNLFHHINKGKCIKGGDIILRDGSDGYSIYGKRFKSENYNIKHDSRGILSMTSCAPGSRTLDSRFLITLGPAPEFDRKHVAFGKLIEGEETLRLIEKVQVDHSFIPVPIVKIIGCGELDYEADKASKGQKRCSYFGEDQHMKKQARSTI